eukprot:3040330-Pleurochrysis_carterae.AAC.1
MADVVPSLHAAIHQPVCFFLLLFVPARYTAAESGSKTGMDSSRFCGSSGLLRVGLDNLEMICCFLP